MSELDDWDATDPAGYWQQRAEAAEARVRELEADARRYRWLRDRAQKNDAYDRYGPGAHWLIGFFADDSRNAFDAAIDTAMQASREGR